MTSISRTAPKVVRGSGLRGLIQSPHLIPSTVREVCICRGSSARRVTLLAMLSFTGSEAIASGMLTRGQLRWNCTALHPDVYIVKGRPRDVLTNAESAFLWTRRTGIVAGQAAAALYGVGAVTDWTPIELIAKHRGRRPGIKIRDERIEADEVKTIASIRITSPARTALDLARHLPRDEAVVILDQLAAVTGVTYQQVVDVADRYRGARGVKRAWAALALMDGGTRSPKETRIRLMLIDGGLPAPRTSIVLGDGPAAAVIGMGWEEARVGVSHFEPGEASAVQRIQRQELVHRMGWSEIQVIDGQSAMACVSRARQAMRLRRS